MSVVQNGWLARAEDIKWFSETAGIPLEVAAKIAGDRERADQVADLCVELVGLGNKLKGCV